MASELDSLDDLSDTSSVRSDDSYLQALLEWEENLDQLRSIFGMVLMPLLGRYLGRKWSFWAFDRYQKLGLGKAFLLGQS
ncbi:hypothetical protein BD626DRAFT_549893 [Schizophyllum amplum]|uniref:Uncharacterized protein n=2 Tax=Schizophyllum amplum TaxID=97359 RepID=A0A550C642_9AGAR|nr:hypothetical protein BD626DRAFT_549893 [Auriculariopsis ampla]